MQITKSRNQRIAKVLDKEISKPAKSKTQIKPYIIYWRNTNSEFSLIKNWSKRGKYDTEEKANQALIDFKKNHSDFEFKLEYKP